MRRLFRKLGAVWHGASSACLAAVGCHDAAFKHGQTAVDLCPTSAWLRYSLALIYDDERWDRHSDEKALECLREAAHLAPRRLRYRELLLYRLLADRRYEEAAEEIELLRPVNRKAAQRLEDDVLEAHYPATWRE